MSYSSTRSKRDGRLESGSQRLHKDVEQLENALYLHHRFQEKEKSSVKGMLREELGGARWQHGGTGKLLTYKSSKDLKDPYEEFARQDVPRMKVRTDLSSKKSSKLKSETTGRKKNHADFHTKNKSYKKEISKDDSSVLHKVNTENYRIKYAKCSEKSLINRGTSESNLLPNSDLSHGESFHLETDILFSTEHIQEDKTAIKQLKNQILHKVGANIIKRKGWEQKTKHLQKSEGCQPSTDEKCSSHEDILFLDLDSNDCEKDLPLADKSCQIFSSSSLDKLNSDGNVVPDSNDICNVGKFLLHPDKRVITDEFSTENVPELELECSGKRNSFTETSSRSSSGDCDDYQKSPNNEKGDPFQQANTWNGTEDRGLITDTHLSFKFDENDSNSDWKADDQKVEKLVLADCNDRVEVNETSPVELEDSGPVNVILDTTPLQTVGSYFSPKVHPSVCWETVHDDFTNDNKANAVPDVNDIYWEKEKRSDIALESWLHSLDLKDTAMYIRLFKEEQIQMENVMVLSEKHLKDMGVTACDALSKIVKGIKELKQKKDSVSLNKQMNFDFSEPDIKLGWVTDEQGFDCSKHKGKTSKKDLPFELVKKNYTNNKTEETVKPKRTVKGKDSSLIVPKTRTITSSLRTRSPDRKPSSKLSSAGSAQSKTKELQRNKKGAPEPGKKLKEDLLSKASKGVESAASRIKEQKLKEKEDEIQKQKLSKRSREHRDKMAAKHLQRIEKKSDPGIAPDSNEELKNNVPEQFENDNNLECNLTVSCISTQTRTNSDSSRKETKQQTEEKPLLLISENGGEEEINHHDAQKDIQPLSLENIHVKGEAIMSDTLQRISDVEKVSEDVMSNIQSQLQILKERSKSDKDSLDIIKHLQKHLLDVESKLADGSVKDSNQDQTSCSKSSVGDKSVDHDMEAQATPSPMRGSSHEILINEEVKDTKGKPETGYMSLSKRELMEKIRKEKDDYKKQIKHLQSELSRIKHKDPFNTFELHSEDIKFSPQDMIGEGSFSQVYKGSYQKSDVAVKQLSVPLSHQDKNYFAAEVSLLKELRHPHVVLLIGVCVSERLPLMVLEFMPGGSLYRLIHRTSKANLDHAEYYQIARDIALGMNYLHNHKPSVLHLDLKSMNVLIGNGNRAKIADFGFSKLRHESGSKNKQMPGTPAWMAPELLSKGEVTTKVDVYSYGIILWEMLTRKQPHEGCSVFQILENLRKHKRPQIPEDCPTELREFISKCWHHNPAMRPLFKDILVTLESLSFPPSWRALFNAADVPGEALDDLQSARDIISLVTTTLDAEMIDSIMAHGLQSPDEKPSTVSLLQDCSDKEQKTDCDVNSSESVTLKSDVNSSNNSAILSVQCSDCPNKNIPAFLPPPPPLPPPLLSYHSTKNSSTESEKVQTKKKQITSSKPHLLVQSMDLLQQRERLRPTDNPHPNQLQDLSKISREKFSSIAEILKKAVVDRRSKLGLERTSIETQSTSSELDWSL